jgi:hypothetical protein
MKRAVLVVVVLVLVCCPLRPFAQRTSVALAEKIASLDGLWRFDPTKGVLGFCGNTIDETIRFAVSAQGVTVDSRRVKGLMRFDGSPTTMTGLGNFNGVASAATDAGWLAITIRRKHNGASGGTGVVRDVFIAGGDELTIWETFNLELPDGSFSQDVCGNRRAVVYQRQR